MYVFFIFNVNQQLQHFVQELQVLGGYLDDKDENYVFISLHIFVK